MIKGQHFSKLHPHRYRDRTGILTAPSGLGETMLVKHSFSPGHFVKSETAHGSNGNRNEMWGIDLHWEKNNRVKILL